MAQARSYHQTCSLLPGPGDFSTGYSPKDKHSAKQITVQRQGCWGRPGSGSEMPEDPGDRVGAPLLPRTNSCGHLGAGCGCTDTALGAGTRALPQGLQPVSQLPLPRMCQLPRGTRVLHSGPWGRGQLFCGASMFLMQSLATGSSIELPTGNWPARPLPLTPAPQRHCSHPL